MHVNIKRQTVVQSFSFIYRYSMRLEMKSCCLSTRCTLTEKKHFSWHRSVSSDKETSEQSCICDISDKQSRFRVDRHSN
jgi:hypothetical protein